MKNLQFARASDVLSARLVYETHPISKVILSNVLLLERILLVLHHDTTRQSCQMKKAVIIRGCESQVSWDSLLYSLLYTFSVSVNLLSHYILLTFAAFSWLGVTRYHFPRGGVEQWWRGRADTKSTTATSPQLWERERLIVQKLSTYSCTSKGYKYASTSRGIMIKCGPVIGSLRDCEGLVIVIRIFSLWQSMFHRLWSC